MTNPASSLGKVHVDPAGKKPVRVGQNIDGVDMLSIGQQIKEAMLAGTKKQKETLEKNQDVVIPAISALQTKVSSLKADTVALSNYLGQLPGIPNSFNELQASVVKSGEYSNATYANVTVDNNVAKATINPTAIRITQLASVDSRITNSTATILNSSLSAIVTPNDPLGLTGSFSINDGSTITISASDTLTTVVAAINNSNSNVQASFVQNGSNYYLIINGKSVATPITFVDSGNLLATNFGINTSTPTNVANLQAQIQCDVVDGANGIVTKTYSFNSNTVTGLIPGVTLKLLNTTLNGSGGYDNLNITINNNSQNACDKILEFYQRFNEIREMLNRNLMADEDGKPLDKDASMFRSPLIKALSRELDAIANFSLVGAATGDYTSCQDIGIVPDANATGFQTGTYTVTNAQTLLAAVNNNFDKVKKLFGNYATVSNSNFSVDSLGSSLPYSIAGKPITITLSNNAGNYYANFSGGGINTGNISQSSQYLISGPEGTAFEKMSIKYSGPPIASGESITFTLTATQGLAATSSVELDQILDKQSGAFSTELLRLKQRSEKLKEKVEKAEKYADKFEKKWEIDAARLDAERARYKDMSRMLEQFFDSKK